jgi:hypothetical protein
VGREKTKAQTSGVKRGLGNNCKKIIIKKRGNNNKKTLNVTSVSQIETTGSSHETATAIHFM